MRYIYNASFKVSGFNISDSLFHQVILNEEPVNDGGEKRMPFRIPRPKKHIISPPCSCILKIGDKVVGRTDPYLHVIITAASACLTCSNAGTDYCKYYQPGQ